MDMYARPRPTVCDGCGTLRVWPKCHNTCVSGNDQQGLSVTLNDHAIGGEHAELTLSRPGGG